MKSLPIAIFLLLATALYADSVLMLSSAEMIDRADFIAIVEYKSAERGTFQESGTLPGQQKRTSKRYSQRTTVRVVENLKGKLPGEIKIHEMSGLWDSLFQNHQSNSEPSSGRYVIFLTEAPDFLTGANGWASTSRIVGEDVEWTEQPEAPKFEMVKLSNILQRVKKQSAAN